MNENILKNEIFKKELAEAIEQGKSVDYSFDGENEIAYDTFETYWAVDAVIEVIKKWGKL